MKTLLDQGLDASQTGLNVKPKQSASASFGSQQELDNFKHGQELIPAGRDAPRQIRRPMVEPLLNITKLMYKDIKQEQQRLMVKSASPVKPKIKTEPKTLQANQPKGLGHSKCCRMTLSKGNIDIITNVRLAIVKQASIE